MGLPMGLPDITDPPPSALRYPNDGPSLAKIFIDLVDM
jgi:hypothetical protein